MYYDYIWCFVEPIAAFYDYILEFQKLITVFYVLSLYLVLFRTNHNTESSLHQNEALGYFGLTSSELASKRETTKWKNENLK